MKGEPSVATEIETHARNLLEALYEAHRADTDQDEATASYLEEAGLDPVQDGFAVVDFLADRGMVKTHHTLGTPCGWITPDGIHIVQGLHAKRTDPKVRAALLRTEMLRWLDGQEYEGLQPDSFQEFVDALTEDSETFSERELRGAAEYLQRNQLLEAVHVEESTEGWIHPRLTPEGREYITDHGGDVAEFLRDRRRIVDHAPPFTSATTTATSSSTVRSSRRTTAPASTSKTWSRSPVVSVSCFQCSGSTGQRRTNSPRSPTSCTPKPPHRPPTVVGFASWSVVC
jgi:hypothetical protein